MIAEGWHPGLECIQPTIDASLLL